MSEPSLPGSSRPAVAVEFRRRFGAEPEVVVRAPGRVNLVGEHTDYNDGFVLPMAIDRWVWMALRSRGDLRVSLHSTNLAADSSFSIDDLGVPGREWFDYAKGTAWALREVFPALVGFDAVLGGDIPVGAGLSSSAALEMAVARAFAEVSGLAADPLVMARAGRRAENDWIGVRCGIMDQLISAGARTGHAALIDCRSLGLRHVPLPREAAVVVLDTSTRRRLSGSAYNDRRAQCSAAAAACGCASLREVSQVQISERRGAMGEVAFRRARHVLSENARTVRAAEALREGDTPTVGRLMNESHRSLAHDFEVSTTTLDVLAETARTAPGCYGARLTGAGFGGCVVALVARTQAEAFVAHALAGFAAATGLTPVAHRCEAVAGAEVLAPDAG